MLLIEKCKESLIKTTVSGYLARYFDANPDLNFSIINIFSPSEPEKMLIPFRNKDCNISSNCIYDIVEVLAFLEENDFAIQKKRECKFCDKKVRLSEFFKDNDLYIRIENIWKTFNQKEVICMKMKVNNDGTYKAIIDKSGISETIELQKHLCIYESLPNINSFEENEFQELMQNNGLLANEDGNYKKIEIFRVLGLKLRKNDLKHLYNQYEPTSLFIKFFYHYLTLFQRQNPKKYNKKSKNLHYFFVCKGKLLPTSPGKYEIEILYSPNAQEIQVLKYFKAIFLVFQLENSWFLSYYHVQEKICFIWDFFSKSFSLINCQDLESFSEFLLIEKLRFNLRDYTFAHINCKNKSFYSTNSLEIMNLVHELFMYPDIYPCFISFSETQKDKFSKKMLWLILKLSTISYENVEFFKFLDQEDQPSKTRNFWKIGQQIYKKPSMFVENSSKVPKNLENQSKVLGRVRKIPEEERNSITGNEKKTNSESLPSLNNEEPNETFSESSESSSISLKEIAEQPKNINSNDSNEQNGNENEGPLPQKISIKLPRNSIMKSQNSLKSGLSPIEKKDISPLMKKNEDIGHEFETFLNKEKVKFNEEIKEIPGTSKVSALPNLKIPITESEKIELNEDNQDYNNSIKLLPEKETKPKIKRKFTIIEDIMDENEKKKEVPISTLKIKSEKPKKIIKKERSIRIKTTPNTIHGNLKKFQNIELENNNLEKKTDYFQSENKNDLEQMSHQNKKKSNIKKKQSIFQKNKQLLVPALREALKSDIRRKLIKDMAKDFIFLNYLQNIEIMQKSYNLTQTPAWTQN